MDMHIVEYGGCSCVSTCDITSARVGEVHSLRMQSPGSGHNNAVTVLCTYVGNRGRKQMGGTLMVQITSTEAVKQVINIPQKIILVLAIRKGRLSYVASSCILTM